MLRCIDGEMVWNRELLRCGFLRHLEQLCQVVFMRVVFLGWGHNARTKFIFVSESSRNLGWRIQNFCALSESCVGNPNLRLWKFSRLLQKFFTSYRVIRSSKGDDSPIVSRENKLSTRAGISFFRRELGSSCFEGSFMMWIPASCHCETQAFRIVLACISFTSIYIPRWITAALMWTLAARVAPIICSEPCYDVRGSLEWITAFFDLVAEI